MSKLPLLAAGVSALALGLAACGGSSSSSSSAAAPSTASSTASSAPAAATTSASTSASAGGSGTLSIAAQPSGMLMFTKKTLTAKAGTVTIAFTNMSPESHNFTIQRGTSGAIVGATPTFDGGTKTLTVKLAAGKYTFFCSVPGHRMAGMQGTLTVT